mgnify:CR=1 FL=1
MIRKISNPILHITKKKVKKDDTQNIFCEMSGMSIFFLVGKSNANYEQWKDIF